MNTVAVNDLAQSAQKDARRALVVGGVSVPDRPMVPPIGQQNDSTLWHLELGRPRARDGAALDVGQQHPLLGILDQAENGIWDAAFDEIQRSRVRQQIMADALVKRELMREQVLAEKFKAATGQPAPTQPAPTQKAAKPPKTAQVDAAPAIAGAANNAADWGMPLWTVHATYPVVPSTAWPKMQPMPAAEINQATRVDADRIDKVSVQKPGHKTAVADAFAAGSQTLTAVSGQNPAKAKEIPADAADAVHAEKPAFGLLRNWAKRYTDKAVSVWHKIPGNIQDRMMLATLAVGSLYVEMSGMAANTAVPLVSLGMLALAANRVRKVGKTAKAVGEVIEFAEDVRSGKVEFSDKAQKPKGDSPDTKGAKAPHLAAPRADDQHAKNKRPAAQADMAAVDAFTAHATDLSVVSGGKAATKTSFWERPAMKMLGRAWERTARVFRRGAELFSAASIPLSNTLMTIGLGAHAYAEGSILSASVGSLTAMASVLGWHRFRTEEGRKELAALDDFDLQKNPKARRSPADAKATSPKNATTTKRPALSPQDLAGIAEAQAILDAHYGKKHAASAMPTPQNKGALATLAMMQQAGKPAGRSAR